MKTEPDHRSSLTVRIGLLLAQECVSHIARNLGAPVDTRIGDVLSGDFVPTAWTVGSDHYNRACELLRGALDAFDGDGLEDLPVLPRTDSPSVTVCFNGIEPDALRGWFLEFALAVGGTTAVEALGFVALRFEDGERYFMKKELCKPAF